MKSSLRILLILTFLLFGCILSCAFDQPAYQQDSSKLVWHSVDVGATFQIWANGAVIIGIPVAIILAIFAIKQVKESRSARHAELTLRLFEHYQSDHIRKFRYRSTPSGEKIVRSLEK